MKKIIFFLTICSLLSNCTKEAETKRLGKSVADFKTFQYDIGTPAGFKYKWRHFKWEDNRLMFDSIPDRFQFEETRLEKIASFRAFTERFPIVLTEKKPTEWAHCNYFMYPGYLGGIVSNGSQKFEWSIDPNTICNDVVLRPFVEEMYAFFDKMNE